MPCSKLIEHSTRLLRMITLWAILTVSLATAALAQNNQVHPSERVQSAVNVRAEPTTSSAVLDRLRPGENLEYLGEVPFWYRVRLEDGRAGYVSKAWTDLLEAAAAAAALYRVHAIDLGTGLAIFVEAPDFTLLYDGGSNDDRARGTRNRLLAYLRHARPDLRIIDHLILSHPHRDHVELLPDVFDQYEIRDVWDSGRLHPICGYRAFLTRVQAEAGVKYHDAHQVTGPHIASFAGSTCYGQAVPAESIVIPHSEPIRAGARIVLGTNAAMTFLHADAEHHSSPNENSLVVRLDLGSERVLLMGDAEAGGRQDPSLPPHPNSIEGRLLTCCFSALRSGVLLVGHHGSKTSSRVQFLDAVGARIFLISAGPTRYGSVTLPDREVVEELERRGSVWRTDLDDAACGRNPEKIGPDNDNKPGGCDNVLISISPSGDLAVSYRRVAD